jgi:hypothetical protein
VPASIVVGTVEAKTVKGLCAGDASINPLSLIDYARSVVLNMSLLMSVEDLPKQPAYRQDNRKGDYQFQNGSLYRGLPYTQYNLLSASNSV